jgi:TPR repeat protein
MSSSSNNRDVKHKSSELKFKEGLDYLAKDQIENAINCFKEADNQGHLDAKVKLGDCYLHGVGVEQDDTAAFQLYRAAAMQGHLDAKFRYAVCHQGGIGIERDDEEAFKLHKVAADLGHPGAQTALAKYYKEAKEFRQAAKYFERAAKQNNPDAQFELGLCYQNGSGVERNIEKADIWMQKAAKQKHTGAIARLAQQHKELNDEFVVVVNKVDNTQKGFFEDGMVDLSYFSKDNATTKKDEKKQTPVSDPKKAKFGRL